MIPYLVFDILSGMRFVYNFFSYAIWLCTVERKLVASDFLALVIFTGHLGRCLNKGFSHEDNRIYNL